MNKHFLDVTKDHCPMSFVKTKLKLKELRDEDVLEVLIAGAEQLHSIPWVAEQSGFAVVDKIEQGPNHLIIIRASEASKV